MIELRFNDGEFIGNYNSIDDAIKIKSEIFHAYLSRYAIAYINGQRVNLSSLKAKKDRLIPFEW